VLASSSLPLAAFSSGQLPGVDLDRAMSLAAALEDEETLRKLDMRK
jgi:hypothetical protein